MKKQTKIIAAIVLALVVIIGGYYGYQKYSLNKRVQTSDKMMKDKGIKQNNTDKAIADEILKNDNDLEYAYISHNGETIMLNLKVKKGIQDKEKYTKVSKYMDKVRTQYKGNNVNATVIPN
ncbi:hypothetical protein, partial [Clostridium drakei]|uniref:DUF3139 domain-containing protein n=1 Tax=Clostridium drakei TaxID=332101 RepID=A0A2U8DKK4_9CLOT